MRLDKATRAITIKKELADGAQVFETVRAKVDGVERDVIVCKKWGAILFDKNHLLICDNYPLIELNEINFGN